MSFDQWCNLVEAHGANISGIDARWLHQQFAAGVPPAVLAQRLRPAPVTWADGPIRYIAASKFRSLAVGVIALLLSMSIVALLSPERATSPKSKLVSPSLEKPQPVHEDPWQPARANLYDGITLYWRMKPGDEPIPYIQIREASLRQDGQRVIRYAYVEGSGEDKFVLRDEFNRWPIVVDGSLLVRKRDLPY